MRLLSQLKRAIVMSVLEVIAKKEKQFLVKGTNSVILNAVLVDLKTVVTSATVTTGETAALVLTSETVLIALTNKTLALALNMDMTSQTCKDKSDLVHCMLLY